jgi:hypothetical protein
LDIPARPQITVVFDGIAGVKNDPGKLRTHAPQDKDQDKDHQQIETRKNDR